MAKPQKQKEIEEEEDQDEECRDDKDELELMSEVHVGCPPNLSGPYISRFTFPFPISTDKVAGRHDDQMMISLDEDGDLVLARQSNDYQRYPICALTIQHNITSLLPDVGLQVWIAALVLTDFVLHRSSTSSEFNGIIALELGAGTGLVGIALALVAKTVFVTDRGSDVLDNCATNVHLNSSLPGYPKTSVHVRELDWTEHWPPSVQICSSESQRSRYSWTPSEIEEAEGAAVLLAADVIYSDELTHSFFTVLERLMSRGSEKVLYLALEKRYNFSMDDLDVVANGYAYFRSFLKVDEECTRLDDHMLPCFKGEQIDLAQVPQYIREYERGKDVELWKITYCSKKPLRQ